jgi:GTPase SAR1 family protein
MGVVKDLITTFVGDRLIELMKSGTDFITEEVCQVANNKILEYLCTEYERNYKTKTILHRSEPVELDKFYQPLFIAKGSERWRKDVGQPLRKRIETNKIENLFVNGNCITIIGTAGSGKSTLVKYLFVNSIKSNYKIPLKIELRYINSYEGDLISYIKEEIVKFSRIAESDRIIEKLLFSGAFVIFLDGYDEVSSMKKEMLTNDICKITKKYRNNSYILTSRPFVDIDMLDYFHNYYICDLTDEEIKTFIKKQFNDTEQELANKIIETISNEGGNTYKSFLSNPLLLSMFIITYQADSNIPQKRSDYYNQVFSTLYSVHDTSSKLGFVRERRSGLLKEDYTDILKRFSFKSFFNQKYSFRIDYIETQLNKLKKDLQLSFANEDLIYDLKVAIGILTQEGAEITFPHRSLQEYFAALYVTTVSISNKDKIYDVLHPIFKEMFRMGRIQGNNSNFFLLLKEMDDVEFKKHLIIPSLSELVEQKKNVKTTDEVINCFLSLYGLSLYVSTDMYNEFRSEDRKYGNHFSTYRKEIDVNKGEDDRKKVMAISDKARDILVQKDILPFLGTYNIEKVIDGIKNSITASENLDAEFIDTLMKD